MTASSPPPTEEAAPGSLRWAAVCANPPLPLLWPTPSTTSSTPLRGRAFVGAPRAPRSSPGSSEPTRRLCPPRGSPRPPTGERGGGIADPPAAAAPLSPRGPTPLRCVRQGFEHESLGVHQDVAFTPLDLLSSVVTPLFAAHRGALERLAVHDARAGLGIPFQADPKRLFCNSPRSRLPEPSWSVF